jgi:hypothetical protein
MAVVEKVIHKVFVDMGRVLGGVVLEKMLKGFRWSVALSREAGAIMLMAMNSVTADRV